MNDITGKLSGFPGPAGFSALGASLDRGAKHRLC